MEMPMQPAKAMQPVADKLGITVEQLATQILDKDYEKVNACIQRSG